MNLGIAFSGGGFRATLFHLGVVRYLRDEGRLADVTHICSVSGGSVLAAHLVQNWERYTGTKEEFQEAASEVIAFVQSDVRGRILRRFLTCWPTLLFRDGGRFDSWRVPATRLLEAYYHRQLFANTRPRKFLHGRGISDTKRCEPAASAGRAQTFWGFDLRLMSSLNDVSGIPTEDKNRIIVAAVNNVLHFRICDGDGKVVVDTDEKRLTEQARRIEDLRKQLESLWSPHELTRNNVLHFRIVDGDGKVVVDTDEKRLTEQARQIEDLRKQLERLWPLHELTKSDKDRVITAVTSIVGHTSLWEAYYKDDARGGSLAELSSDLAAKPYCHILATNLNYGTVSAFMADGYVYEPKPGDLAEYPASSAPIALAVTTSSAYPALFAPIRLTPKRLRDSAGFLQDEPHLLTDGGVFDNLGVHHFRSILKRQSYFPLLRASDLADPPRIINHLLSGEERDEMMPFARMWNRLASKNQQDVRRAKDRSEAAGPELAAALNYLIHRRDLYDSNDWQSIALEPEIQSLIQRCVNTPGREVLFLRNRLLLESAFPGAIAGCVGQQMKVIVSDAGRAFNRIKEIEFSDFILSTAVRASDVLMNRIGQIEMEAAQADKDFLIININDTVDNVADPTSPAVAIQRAVSQIRTDLDEFTDPEVSGLVRHGYCVARQAFTPLLTGPSACQNDAPWDPVRPSNHDYNSTNAADVQTLDASKYRRKRLFSFRDWVSYLHLGLLALMVLVGWFLWGWATGFISELVLITHAGVTYTAYQAPSLKTLKVVDPYYLDNDLYREADQIEEPDFRGFTVDSDDRIFDLQNWKPAGPGLTVDSSNDAAFQNWVVHWRQMLQDERDKRLRSLGEPMFLTREVLLSKKNDQDVPQGARNDEIRFQFLTEGFGIAPSLDTSAPYKWYVERSKKLGSVGPRKTKKWNLVVKLPDEEPMKPITLKIKVVYWNGFQDQKEEWASVKLNSPTREVSLWVLFPETKPYDTYILQQYVIDQRAAARIATARPLTNKRKTKLFWRLTENPDPQQIYEVRWSW